MGLAVLVVGVLVVVDRRVLVVFFGGGEMGLTSSSESVSVELPEYLLVLDREETLERGLAVGEVGIGVVVVVLRELELSLLALFFGPTVVHRSASLDCGEVSCSGSEPNSSASVGWTVLSSAGEE